MAINSWLSISADSTFSQKGGCSRAVVANMLDCDIVISGVGPLDILDCDIIASGSPYGIVANVLDCDDIISKRRSLHGTVINVLHCNIVVTGRRGEGRRRPYVVVLDCDIIIFTNLSARAGYDTRTFFFFFFFFLVSLTGLNSFFFLLD